MHLRLAAIEPDDLATLVYTSGTTGPPKGCMLSHANILETTRMYVEQLKINETHTLYQFLPLAHVLARVAQAVVIRAGARACFWSGNPARIIDELSELQPTHFPAVPRIYEKIHSAVLGKAQDGPGLKRALFHWALNSGSRVRRAQRDGTDPGLLAGLQFRLADRLVLSKIRSVFGPEHQMAMVGAAPVARELLEFFDACGVLVLEGYGMTESCAAATLNTHSAARLGTVGRPLPGTEIGIADDGEILIRGPHVFKGYYKDSVATEVVLTPEGWLCTGDLGAIREGGFIAITGRKKDLIITSSGKNITPVNIESELRDSRYITEAVVFGDNRPYLVAMLTLDPDQARILAARARRRNRAGDDCERPADPRRDPEGRRRCQPEARADRTDQALCDPRSRPQPSGRRADPDAEGQTRVRLREVRPRIRRSVRRRRCVVSSSRFSSADAAWLHMDRPTNLMVINSVMLFDEPVDWDRVRLLPRSGWSTRTRVSDSAPSRAASRCGRRNGSMTRISCSSTTCTIWHSRHRATRRRCRSSSAI